MGKGDIKTKKGKITNKSYGKHRPRKKRRKINFSGTEGVGTLPLTAEEIVAKLSSLDLSKYPEKEVKQLLNAIGKVGYIVFTLHPGKTIIRARGHKNNSEVCKTISDISFKPQENNTTYQRASTPNSTMFYGCVVPEPLDDKTYDNARVTALLEVSNLCRNNIPEGEEKLTYSRWVVTKDIPLIAIMHHKNFVDRSVHATELYNAYQAFLTAHPEQEEKSRTITEYLASEFAKAKISGDFDYLISAIFSEMVTSKGLAGIYFPSVRAEALGFNVAISPKFVKDCMKSLVAGECTVYKKENHVIVGNDTITEIGEGQVNFEMKTITDPNINLSKEQIRKKLEEPV